MTESRSPPTTLPNPFDLPSPTMDLETTVAKPSIGKTDLQNGPILLPDLTASPSSQLPSRHKDAFGNELKHDPWSKP